MATKKPVAKKTVSSKKAMPAIAIMIMPKMSKKAMKEHEGKEEMGMMMKKKNKKDMS